MTEDNKTAPGKPYTCEACKGEFIGSRTHEECVAEEETIFDRETSDEDRAIVCHNCWVKLMRAMGYNVPDNPEDEPPG